MYVSERLLITRPMGRVNLLQFQSQLASITPDVDVKPHVGTFILDIDDVPHVGPHLGSAVLELKVISLWLKV